jgi:PKD repeat protein
VDIIIYDVNPNASYSWSFGDGGTSAYPFPFWTYDENGPYEVCLTVTDLSAGCSASFCDSVSVDEFGILVGAGLPLSGFTINVVDGGESNETSGLEDVSIAQTSISIYPNPTKGMTFVDGIAANASWKGTIFNSNGSVAKTCSGVGPETVSLEELSPGLYLFSLDMAAGGRHTSRIVVE